MRQEKEEYMLFSISTIFSTTLALINFISSSYFISVSLIFCKAAFSIEGAEAIIAHLAPELRPGDVVVIMSNGGFGGIHQKMLEAIEARKSAEDGPAGLL